jgi:hypothetical protein
MEVIICDASGKDRRAGPPTVVEVDGPQLTVTDDNAEPVTPGHAVPVRDLCVRA